MPHENIETNRNRQDSAPNDNSKIEKTFIYYIENEETPTVTYSVVAERCSLKNMQTFSMPKNNKPIKSDRLLLTECGPNLELRSHYNARSTSCVASLLAKGGKHSMSNRKEGRKYRGNTTSKHPNGYPPREVFEKAATKKDDHNHPNSFMIVKFIRVL